MKHKHTNHLFFSIAIALMCLSFAGQAQQYNFINYSIEDGLAQSQVETIFQDNKGYLWIGTLGGISKFNGTEFENYSTADGLMENQINSIIQDRRGVIWIGTIGGIMKFDGGKFQNYRLKSELSGANVTCIAEDKSGNLWLGTDGKGICKFSLLNASDNQNDQYQIQYFTTDNGLSHNKIRSIHCDLENNLWIGTRKGISKYNGDKFMSFSPEGLESVNVSHIELSVNGNLLIGTFGDGLIVYNLKTDYEGDNNFQQYTSEDGLISDWVRQLLQDDHGNIWIASKKGVSKINFRNKSKGRDVHVANFTTQNGLVTNNVNCILKDSEGNLWLGTDGKGMLKFTGEAFVSYTQQDGLSSDIVMSIIEDADDNLWFSTYGNGICKYDIERSEYVYYDIKDGISNNTVWTSILDKDDNLWFGTSNGVTRFNGRSFQTYSKKDGLISNKVTSIFQDQTGNIWFGTPEGISMFRNYYFTNYSQEQEFYGKNVRSILQDNQGILWFGCSNGLFRYDGRNFIKFTEEDGLSNNTIYTIREDAQGGLWLGTKNGLTYYDKSSFLPLKVGKDYRSNIVNFIIFDEAQNLWAGTNNGIFKLNVPNYKKSGVTHFDHYTNWEGITGLETNLNAAYKDSRGKMWFCTNDGVVKYDPTVVDLTFNDVEPFINIKGISLFRENVDWSKFTDEFDTQSGLPKNLALKHNQNHFTFSYAGISHTNPLKVQYKFKLNGFDEDWSPSTSANFATYSNLPPGLYEFRVLASNKQNTWNTVPATFTFEILPPFWTAWWFYSLCICTLAAIAFAIYRWRTNVIKRKIETQRLIHKSKMLVLEQKSLNASMNRHFIFNALNSIQYYINKQDKKAANDYLTNFAKLIRKNLDDAQNNLVSLAEELERLELYLSLEHMRFNNKFNYKIKLDEDIDAESVKIPSMLIQPFVENSIWHGILPMDKKGIVMIDIKKNEEGQLVFAIEDNGIGIDTSIQKKLGKPKDHVSKGMNITKGRINLLKKMTNKNVYIDGPKELKDENNQANGTKVEIVLPINYN